jgi:hypothetical protein
MDNKDIEKRFADLELKGSHTKRTADEGLKKIVTVEKQVSEIHEGFFKLTADLTGDKGYFKQIDKNSSAAMKNAEDIDLSEIRLSKTEGRLIKMLIVSFALGSLFTWVVTQYSIQQKNNQGKTDIVLYHKPNELIELPV